MFEALARTFRAGGLSRKQAPTDAPAYVFGGRGPDLPIPEAAEYVQSTEDVNLVQCSRRAGKTWSAVDRHIELHKSLPEGSWTHFGSLVKRNAYKHFWMPIKERLTKLGWRYTTQAQHMILRTERGTYMQAFGCDDMAGTAAVQGDSSMCFTIDECHLDRDDVLEALIRVATPMLGDGGGKLDLLGLSPDAKGGIFDSMIQRRLDRGAKVFHWTMFDHDFPRKREEKMATVVAQCAEQGLALRFDTVMGADGRPRYIPVVNECHPFVLQQYFGQRVTDPSKLAYDYQVGRNDYDPSKVYFDGGDTRSSAGLDLGWDDNDAIVVHSWFRWAADGERCAYSRFTWQRNHVPFEVLADIVEAVNLTYRPVWVGDTGGHGAVKVLESLAGQLRMRFHPKPTDVLMSVRLLNSDYRTGRMKHPTMDTETARVLATVAKMPWAEDRKARCRLWLRPAPLEKPTDKRMTLAEEIAAVRKTVNARTNKVEINKKGAGVKHSDVSESNRYAHAAAKHWAAKDPEPAETLDLHQRRAKWEAEKAKRRKHNERSDD